VTRRLALVACALVVIGCVPRLSPLTGALAPVTAIPRTAVPEGHTKIVFDWELTDLTLTSRGDGAARIAHPDSVRLDFFLAGGFGGGSAVLIGDSLTAPGGDMVRKLVPPPTLLWAALGWAALPNLPDTVVRLDGAVLRADVGRPVAWRFTFHGDTLARADRVDGGKVVEWVERVDSTHVRYRNESSRRSLTLSITRHEGVPDFDASIWRLSR
jgi:hypothetical protein